MSLSRQERDRLIQQARAEGQVTARASEKEQSSRLEVARVEGIRLRKLASSWVEAMLKIDDDNGIQLLHEVKQRWGRTPVAVETVGWHAGTIQHDHFSSSIWLLAEDRFLKGQGEPLQKGGHPFEPESRHLSAIIIPSIGALASQYGANWSPDR